ncbi:prepilin-type N-terminal cleavage/methylation domain-containing protein [Glaciibacter psychrotolerans]|uniref:Type II secretory pathway pseudopilin PulG n=1 Tax=Glaciibacter psychrotolerans TaxID=670054 RepID=A0A7Z0EHV8_9MICO|nr:carboxypeptidase regulatory-like domain-containing protein [Leifsonia psychrotolerans]NYJ21535.1 type II secretory pathway pseudopilin PulG [Leifsonia psychrotolerans]
MKSTRARLDVTSAREAGLSLVEVIVAMMVFAILSIGVIFSLMTMLTQTVDSRAREVAANLAAQEIDSARSASDLFALLDADLAPVTVNGQTFAVHRSTQWVSDPTQDVACGAAKGALQYKRVNVTVRWSGMRGDTPVRADTLLAPKSRISDETQGVILVSVSNELGEGVEGVTITISPSITPAPSATDAQGCSYLLKVPPAAYTITVKKPGYVDNMQKVAPSTPLTIAAGASLSAKFTMDKLLPLNLAYASEFAAVGVKIPTKMSTSLLHSTDVPLDSVAPAAALSRSVSLYPFRDGYAAVAGNYLAKNDVTPGCLSPNPVEWPAGADETGLPIAAQAPQAIVPAVGATAQVPMGVVAVARSGTETVVTAVSVAAPAGTADPGCAQLTMTYTFGAVLAATPVTLALPFGSWQLYYGATANAAKKVPQANMTVTSPSKLTAGIVTLDPRKRVP